jgi:RNA polymerase sigma factor (sigma-70 family)
MEPPPSDQVLIERIGQGDVPALEWVYQTQRGRVVNYVLRHGGTPEDAQDVYQEVMLALYANVVAGRLTHLVGKLSTYLYRLAENQWLSRVRVRNRLIFQPLDVDFPQDEATDGTWQDAFLSRLLTQIDSRCRRILSLYYFERLSMREVAKRVDLPDGESARKRKCDCLAKLRKLVNGYRQLGDEFGDLLETTTTQTDSFSSDR